MSKKLRMEARVISNDALGPAVRGLTLYAPEIAENAKPGQFLHIRPARGITPLLRRPFSISMADPGQGILNVIYRIVGNGTALMAELASGAYVDCMGPLGRGFEITGKRPLIVGGGMGLAPLVFLAGALCPRPITILMGGRSREEMFWPDIFRKACRVMHIATDDGSMGRRGTTLDLLPELIVDHNFDIIYTCGPRLMMEGVAALAKAKEIPCQVSLEEHMACGVGACLSCTCQGNNGMRKKVCSDGPVFWAEEVF